MKNKIINESSLNNKSLHIPEDIILRESNNCFLKNLIITWVGFYETAYGHLVVRESTEEYIMHYCTSGKGWIEVCGKRWAVNKGDSFFYNINESHKYGSDNVEPWSVYWFHFKGKGVPTFLKLLDISHQFPIFHIGEKPKVNALINEIFDYLKSGYSFPYLLHASTCFQELLSYLVNIHMHSNIKNVGDIDIENIMSIMLKNINIDFSLQQFANSANLSVFHFSRKFKEKTGYSPIDYFNRLKIQKACELLDTTNKSIKEISNLLSYSNQYYFSTCFKRISGYSPKKYRETMKLL